MTTPPPRRPSGRPTLTVETLKVVQVRLTTDQIATARRLGNGNASEGVRRALLCQNQENTGTSGTRPENTNKNAPE